MVSIKDITENKKLAIQVQQLLINLKLLSGAADGKIGPQSIGAIAEFLSITKSRDLSPAGLTPDFSPRLKKEGSKTAKMYIAK